jgi:DNA-binding LacI/PurR family transcriptional regulator
MSDVGRLAGVSHQTVSRVINGSPHVRPETRDRVLAAMEQLGYRPNPVARALVTGRSKTLGVVSFDTTLYGPASTLFGIERAAHEEGYFIIVASLESLNRSSVTYAIERLRRQGVEGILVIAPHDEAGEALLHAPADVPLVAAEAGPAHALPVVAVDQVAGAVTATRHLLELGHRRIAFVGDKPPDPYRFTSSRDRTAGYLRALASAGVPERPEYVRAGTQDRQEARSIAERLLAQREPPTAIFAASDLQALGVLEAATHLGVRVPEDLSVVGFDDVEVASYVGLTTVSQQLVESGRRGAHLLLRALSGDDVPTDGELLDLELVVRRTTAPPPLG